MTTIPGFQMIRALWAFRGFVISSVRREFNGKYRESMLGSFWAVANPLAMILSFEFALRYSFHAPVEADLLRKAVENTLASGARTGAPSISGNAPCLRRSACSRRKKSLRRSGGAG